MQSSSPDSLEFIVGTSGHVDHGKTLLVKTLTGIDTDRFEEEKRRGITIDLGFAPYIDEQGTRLAFVDVPGHEKFVHNMLAGVSGFDAVMLVIAADEGVMPQTREHLHICRLLQIPTGLVALTRIDLVEDHEIIDLCRSEVKDLVEGTFLEDRPILPISSMTGEGIPELRMALRDLQSGLVPPNLEQPFRLYVDRSFSVKGFGTVVTGTVLSGSLEAEGEVRLFPENKNLRVRGIQVHGDSRKSIYAGNRAALNLAGISQEAVRRGDQLALGDSLLTSYMLNVELEILEDVSSDLKQRSRVRVHLGSREVMGRVIILESSSLAPGTVSLVQLRLEEQVSSRYGDRFIIRSYSTLRTLGGGRIIDPAPGKSRRIQRDIAERLRCVAGSKNEIRVEEVINLQSVRGVVEHEVALRAGLSVRQSVKWLQGLQSRRKILCVDPIKKRFVHVDHLERVGKFLLKVLETHHRNYPEREGMNRVELGGKLSLLFNDREMEVLLKFYVKNKMLTAHQSLFALPGHESHVSDQTRKQVRQCIEIIRRGGFQPLRRTLILKELGLDEKKGIELLKSAVHEKKLVRVAEDLHYTPEQIDGAIERLKEHFTKNSFITVIEFKELLDISRKYAVELLEYFDTQHLTVREDNKRSPSRIMEG